MINNQTPRDTWIKQKESVVRIPKEQLIMSKRVMEMIKNSPSVKILKAKMP